MGDFLFVTWNGGGNVSPAIVLALQLRSDGHRVRALGPESLAARFADEDIPYRAHRSRSEWAGGPVVRSGGPTAEQRRAYHAGMAEDLLAEIARKPTDTAIVDYMQPDALCAAEHSGMRVAAFVHTLYQRFAITEQTPMSMLATLDEINALRERLHLPPIARLTELLDRASLVLVATARELDQPVEPLAANVRYLGPLVEEPGPDAGWQPPMPDDGRPLVVVSMGTTPMNEGPVLQKILDALGTLPVRVFATVGHHLDPTDFKAPNNCVVSRYVRHSAVLPHARLLVTHAGLGSINAALRFGVPMLCVPLGRDQPANAERVEALGFAGTWTASENVSQLRYRLREWLDAAIGEPSLLE